MSEEQQKVEGTCCPWCGSICAPIATAENLHVAIFNYPSTDLKSHIRSNPLMCPDCFQVGGRVDWGL